MWTRKELKDSAKAGLKRNYWKSVLIGLIVTLVYAGTFVNEKGSLDDVELTDAFSGLSSGEILVALGIFLGAFLSISLIVAVFRAFIYNPLKVGISSYCIEALNGEAKFSTLANGYKPFLSRVWVLFVRDLYLVLWGLLLIVPALVKTYSYSMVPYILADNPGISAKEAISRSRAMMNGNKWNAFVLDLSFLGWNILSSLTFGILGVFYVEPYKMLTDAALYEKLKQNG